jgi:hypothetical protein
MLKRLEELEQSLVRYEDENGWLNKWRNCHTCFVKLPIVTLILVLVVTWLSK